MNEIIIAKTNELGTGKLATTTNKIIDLSNKDTENEKTRACLIANVVNEKLYEKGGFTAASEWAEKYLMMNKSTLSRIVKAANRFSNDVNVWKFFTLSQMFEMSACTDEKLNRLEIKPSMTCKQIRDIIKADDEVITAPNDETPNDEKRELYKSTIDITELAATIRHLGKCYVEYCEPNYAIYTER